MSIELKYNGTFDIATGRNRKETHWKNKETTWQDFVNRISNTHHTAETINEYMASKKSRQDEIKDVGGYVGGYITDGRRKPDNIMHRQLITLDVDFSSGGMWEDFTMLYGNAAAIYSTHKHTKESPRLRLILPLDRPVTTDEYTAIARRVAGILDINAFDDTTYQPYRLMYWPSTSKDGEFYFEYQDGPWLSADEVLASYKNWQDASEWPVSDRAGQVLLREIKKQGDPTEKQGIVGTFCREYDIYEAIETFLSDVYQECGIEDRYTYMPGSTGAGLVIYDDGKYAYSHHGTDPCSGKLCNAFDLVRIHLYGLTDEEAKPGTASNHLPSFLAMVDHASKDPRVRKLIGLEKIQGLQEDFAEAFKGEEGEEVDLDWLSNLDADKHGNYRNTIDNIRIVLDNDPNLKGKLALNKFEQREIAKSNLPWREVNKETRYLNDTDDAGIRHYLEKTYDFTGVQRIMDAVNLTVRRNAFHPVRDYLNTLVWDGTSRIETLLIDYLGAEDSEYTRAVTRKALIAAVARVFNPGCKFDYVLVLISEEQGVGKSTLVKALGLDWFSDSFGSIQGKEAYEAIQGIWILELAELAALKKAEFEQIKHFISKGEDRYRVAYGRRTENFPRQCIFIGTTNNKDFLRDPTGNRRFWPVDTMLQKPAKNVWDEFTREEVGQVWAEALILFKSGEKLYLSKELEETARQKQIEHSEQDDRTGLIQRYLDTLLPVDWSHLDINQRRMFLNGEDELQGNGTVQRTRVCIAEIWSELFNRPQADMNKYNTKELHDIMRRMEGWQEGKTKVRITPYGNQRMYRRVNNHTPTKLFGGCKIHPQITELL